jgi:hypothetical protein
LSSFVSLGTENSFCGPKKVETMGFKSFNQFHKNIFEEMKEKKIEQETREFFLFFSYFSYKIK